MNPTVEVIIVEYRAPARTIACIYSLLHQNVLKVHVVDNSDDEGATRKTLQNEFFNDARVDLIDSGGNIGFASAVNIGVARCIQKRALVINNDAIAGPGMVAELVDSLAKNSRSLIAFPSLVHAGKPLHRVFYNTWLILLTARWLPGSYEVPRGCCMLIAIDRLPYKRLFDEQFFMYGEELELGWRLRTTRNALAWVPAATVMHEGSATSVRGSAFYEERTALAHLLLGQHLATKGVVGTLRKSTRHLAISLRALFRSVRQQSWLPMISLRVAWLHAAARESRMTQPPKESHKL